MKYISIIRTYDKDTDKSTLLLEKDRLVVLGILPHTAQISFSPEEAAKLCAWLQKTYNLKEG